MRRNVSQTVGNSTTSIEDSDSFEEWLWSLAFSNMLHVSVTWSLVPVGLLGLITNSLNIIGYVMIGFHDSVTVCFFVLSVSDLCFTLMVCNTNILAVIGLMLPSWTVNIGTDAFWTTYYLDMALDFSSIIRTLIAIMRACCVVLPFRVKTLFTTTRTVVIVIFICICNVISYVSYEFIKTKKVFTNAITNETYEVETYIDGWEMLSYFHNFFNKTTVVVVCEIFVASSLVFIIGGMLSTSNFHQSLQTDNNNKYRLSQLRTRLRNSTSRNRNSLLHDVRQIQDTVSSVNLKQPGNKKEQRVIQQVTIVSSLYLICNTFEVTFFILDQAINYVNYTYIYMSVYWFFHAFNRFTGPANAAVNFFIYYSFNSKFKQQMSRLCKIRIRLKVIQHEESTVTYRTVAY